MTKYIEKTISKQAQIFGKWYTTNIGQYRVDVVQPTKRKNN